MTHFRVETKSLSDLYTEYPHTPEDIPASIQDYLEDMLSEGWELAGTLSQNNPFWFVFKASGRNS